MVAQHFMDNPRMGIATCAAMERHYVVGAAACRAGRVLELQARRLVVLPVQGFPIVGQRDLRRLTQQRLPAAARAALAEAQA